MSVVDASVWVSLLAADDVNHEPSRRWFEYAIAEGVTFTAPSLVLVGVAGAMTRRTGDQSVGVAAAARLGSIPELVFVELTVESAVRAAAIASRLVLRGADAVYVSLAVDLDAPLVTWDRQQRERSAPLISVSSPADDLSDA
jgi:predicted nucleic acid-binding protein